MLQNRKVIHKISHILYQKETFRNLNLKCSIIYKNSTKIIKEGFDGKISAIPTLTIINHSRDRDIYKW